MTHQPNTPRQRNAKGQKVDEPVQCVQCLQTWPCEVMVLSREIVRLSEIASERDKTIARLADEVDDLRERVHELLDRDDSTLSEGHET
jgi:uncharacterized spore protein YtfJ